MEVDPDEERIRVTKENLADLPSVAVEVGDSVSRIPATIEPLVIIFPGALTPKF